MGLDKIKTMITKIRDNSKMFSYNSIPFVTKQDIFPNNYQQSNTNVIKKSTLTEHKENFGNIQIDFVYENFEFSPENIALTLSRTNFVNLSVSIAEAFKNTEITIDYFKLTSDYYKANVYNKFALKQLEQLPKNTTERIRNVVDMSRRGIFNGKSITVNINAIVNYVNNISNKYDLTFATTSSLLDPKSNILLYASQNDKLKIGFILDSFVPKYNELSFEAKKTKANFTIQFGFGSKSLNDNGFKAMTELYRSDDYLSHLNVTPNNGNMCYGVATKLNLFDSSKVSVRFHNTNKKPFTLNTRLNTEMNLLRIENVIDKKNVVKNYTLNKWQRVILKLTGDDSIQNIFMKELYNNKGIVYLQYV